MTAHLKPPSLVQRLWRLKPYFHRSQWVLALLCLAVLTLALTEPLVPAMLKALLDKGFREAGLSIAVVASSLMGLFLVRGIAAFFADYLLTYLVFNAMRTLRAALFTKMLTVDLSHLHDTTASSMANTIVYEVHSGLYNLVSIFVSMVRNSLILVAMLAYLLYLNWQLTSIVFAILPLIALVMKAISRRVHLITRRTQEATDDLAYVVEENLLARYLVRMQAAQAQQFQRFEMWSARLRQLAMKSTVASAAMTPLTQMLAALALTIVVCIALWQNQSAATADLAAATKTVGGFVAFVTAMLMLVAPIKHISESMTPLTRGLALIERGIEWMQRSPDETTGSHTGETTAPPPAGGDIVFERVSVYFEKTQTQALHNFSLHIRAGEVVAFVGASGSGKTTLMHTLPRLIALSAGTIKLDGVELAQWELSALRRRFALVSQHVVLFNDTLARNVTLGEDTADAQRLQRAIRGAHLEEFVAQLPQGLDTVCGHNALQLSGGQRQRLSIAQAIYKDAPILLLDEATSALDNESERAVQLALQELMQGRTTLIVAHRLSTIQHASRIVVMHRGQVAETGTHAQLLAQNGLYAQLCAGHSQGQAA